MVLEIILEGFQIKILDFLNTGNHGNIYDFNKKRTKIFGKISNLDYVIIRNLREQSIDACKLTSF